MTVAFERFELAPPTGVTAKVTDASGTRLLLASFTTTVNGAVKELLTTVFWLSPELTVTDAAGPGLFVNAKGTGVSAPPVAATVYAPAVELAVAVTLARPDAAVTAVALESVALAPPLAGVTVKF